jgi:hypothetical protein
MEARIERFAIPKSSQHEARTTPLLDVLNGLGISILDAEYVEKYRRTKIAEVAAINKPWFSKAIDGPVEPEQRLQAEHWAAQQRMKVYEIRYFFGLWGLGVAKTRVIGWSVEDGVLENAPLHVREKAAQIRSRMPVANIETEILMDEQHIYDPLVCALHGNERYYFEVYDEPEAERKMF